jgi:hypothetical protein
MEKENIKKMALWKLIYLFIKFAWNIFLILSHEVASELLSIKKWGFQLQRKSALFCRWDLGNHLASKIWSNEKYNGWDWFKW